MSCDLNLQKTARHAVMCQSLLHVEFVWRLEASASRFIPKEIQASAALGSKTLNIATDATSRQYFIQLTH